MNANMCNTNIFKEFFKQLIKNKNKEFNEEDLKSIIKENINLGLEQIIKNFRDCYDQIIKLAKGISLPTEQ
jgi:hypothetical protein